MTFSPCCHYKKMPVCDLQTLISLYEDAGLWPSDSGIIIRRYQSMTLDPGVNIRRAQSVTLSPWCHYKKSSVCDLQSLVPL